MTSSCLDSVVNIGKYGGIFGVDPVLTCDDIEIRIKKKGQFEYNLQVIGGNAQGNWDT